MSYPKPPIAGPGTEMLTILPAIWGHCGLCGYTGRVKGPRQAKCGEKHGWHVWLEKCADEEVWSLWFHSWDRKKALIEAAQ